MDVSQLHIKSIASSGLSFLDDKEDYSLFGDKTNSMMIINSVCHAALESSLGHGRHSGHQPTRKEGEYLYC